VMGQGLFDRVASIWRQLIEGYGMRLHMEDIVAEGDLVAVRYRETGTFKAAAFGREPTGKSYQLVAMELFEIRGGKIARRWGARDAARSASTWGSRALVRVALPDSPRPAGGLRLSPPELLPWPHARPTARKR
jgi:hypothetical protein